MPLTRDEEIEFLFLTRHLDRNDINPHLERARCACEKIEKGLEFADQEEAFASLRSCVFIRDVALAAEKYPKQLQDKFALDRNQLNVCIEITHIFKGIAQSHGKPTLFLERPEHHDIEQLKKLFKRFTPKPASGKTLKV